MFACYNVKGNVMMQQALLWNDFQMLTVVCEVTYNV